MDDDANNLQGEQGLLRVGVDVLRKARSEGWHLILGRVHLVSDKRQLVAHVGAGLLTLGVVVESVGSRQAEMRTALLLDQRQRLRI
eukprot:6195318-Prymnesium_polylepis.1